MKYDLCCLGSALVDITFQIDDDFVNARKKSLDQIKKLNWEDGYYRSDIGHKVIENS